MATDNESDNSVRLEATLDNIGATDQERERFLGLMAKYSRHQSLAKILTIAKRYANDTAFLEVAARELAKLKTTPQPPSPPTCN